MYDLMNGLSELVYVVDIETHELLFMNTAGKEMFGIEDVATLKCYKALHGADQPCSFCTNALLSFDSFYTWEFTNGLVHRHYLLKDKLIDWNGKKARLEIAFDTTEQEKQKTILQNMLAVDAAILDCLKILYTNEDLPEALNEILRVIGTLLNCDRAYIFEIKEGEMRTTYKWHSDESKLRADFSHWLNAEMVNRWYESFARHQCVIIRDIDELYESEPKEYGFLKLRGVKSLVAMPLELDGQISGFIGVSNPPIEKFENISQLLETLAYFITSYTQRHNDKHRLEILSYHDTLTQTLNRNAFTRDLGHISESDKKCEGVICVDVNGMKEINDCHGHPYGDEVLLKTSQIIASVLPDTAVYRIGGDEFVAIMYDITEQQFEAYLQSLENRFADGEDFHVSIGHAWSDYGEDIQRLLFQADEMVNATKKLYYQNQAKPKRYRHENDDILNLTKPGVLQEMLARDEFVLYFQPKFAVSNRELIGAEALVRLCSPSGGLVAPDEFIPLLEETRLISLVDFFVFESACIRIEEWLKQGKKVVPISVNFSRYSLTEKRFSEQLSTIWQRHQIPQDLIELEITESMSADDGEAFLNVVEHMRDLGFIITIDDFGVKQANLALFTLIKFDVLKIDKILISNLEESETSQIVLQSISDICRRMGIHLIVEGVETEEQFCLLQKINCEGAQGYLFDKPLPLDKFEEKYLP